MSYTPTEWKTGDVVTSAKLNKLEQGVADAGGGGVLVVDNVNVTLSETWQTIYDAIVAGTPTYVRLVQTGEIPYAVIDAVYEVSVGDGDVQPEGTYYVSTIGNQVFTCSAGNEYPSAPIVPGG